MASLFDSLQALLPRKVWENELMSAHTSMRTGGPAALWAEVPSAAVAVDCIRLLRETGTPFILLGNGSNVLFPDRGYKGTVLQWIGDGGSVRINGAMLFAEAGETLARLAAIARDAGLTGLEWASGIPGCLGAAVAINAGAFGGDMQGVIKEVRVLTREGEQFPVPAEELEYAYRSSRVQRGGWYVLSATLRLSPGSPKDIDARMKELAARRREKQPLTLPSCGSAFKRPLNGYAAALIEQAGCKGWQEGGAQVSTLHAGFIVNTGSATTADVLRLMERVASRVYDCSGVRLTPEIQSVEEV